MLKLYRVKFAYIQAYVSVNDRTYVTSVPQWPA